jgi:hypothetical protein
MARLFWLLIMVGLVGALLIGVSWVAAYSTIGNLLGAPPPQMGTQTTTLLWRSLPKVHQNPPVWLFAYGPTVIPGATTARIYVGPWGRLVRTDPADLETRITAFRRPKY